MQPNPRARALCGASRRTDIYSARKKASNASADAQCSTCPPHCSRWEVNLPEASHSSSQPVRSASIVRPRKLLEYVDMSFAFGVWKSGGLRMIAARCAEHPCPAVHRQPVGKLQSQGQCGHHRRRVGVTGPQCSPVLARCTTVSHLIERELSVSTQRGCVGAKVGCSWSDGWTGTLEQSSRRAAVRMKSCLLCRCHN